MAMLLEITESGGVLLPTRLRRKYGLSPGDRLALVELDGALLLRANPSRVDELGREIEQVRKAAGLSVKDLLSGLEGQRRRINREKK